MLCFMVPLRSTQDRSPAKERGQKAGKVGEVPAEEGDGGEEEADAVSVRGESDDHWPQENGLECVVFVYSVFC